MARIAGVDLPRNRKVEIALRYIVGIGRTTAGQVLKQANVDPSTRTDALSEDQISRISKIIEAGYRVEGDVRRENTANIKRLIDLGTYRGLRHRKGLPVRGQRTHTNARTRKGPRKAAIVGKKKAPSAK